MIKKYILILFLIIFISVAFAEEFHIGENELNNGKSLIVSQGDKIIVVFEGEDYEIYVTKAGYITHSGESQYGYSKVRVTNHNEQTISFAPSWEPKMNFDLDLDTIYDLSISLDEKDIDFFKQNKVEFTLKKIHEETPDDVRLTYSCAKFYTCPNGEVVNYLEPSGSGCANKGNPFLLCDTELTSCNSYYTCESGKSVRECSLVGTEGFLSYGCECLENPEERCQLTGDGSGDGDKCSDSDGGQNFFENGEIESKVDNKKGDDICASDDKGLWEFSCNSDGSIFREYYVCKEGCKDGACIESYSCGDGICQEKTCSSAKCPIAETEENCPQDCGKISKCPTIELKKCPEGSVAEFINDSNGCSIGSKCYFKPSREKLIPPVEVKIMPEKASEIAIKQLQLLNYSIELKEVGNGKDEPYSVVYELKGKKNGRFFGLFNVQMEVETLIDPESGELLSTKNPWWSFLVI